MLQCEECCKLASIQLSIIIHSTLPSSEKFQELNYLGVVSFQGEITGVFCNTYWPMLAFGMCDDSVPRTPADAETSRYYRADLPYLCLSSRSNCLYILELMGEGVMAEWPVAL